MSPTIQAALAALPFALAVGAPSGAAAQASPWLTEHEPAPLGEPAIGPVIGPVIGGPAPGGPKAEPGGKVRVVGRGDPDGWLYYGDYGAPLWTSYTFQGTHDRHFLGDMLVLDVVQDHPEGGIDTALSRNENEKPAVSAVHEKLAVCFRYGVSLHGEGIWWAGPKISVNWNNAAGTETSGWHENYIVETAKETPDQLEQRLKDIFGARFIGETRQDGSTYRHFTFPFLEWDQYWAIRQDYRSEGVTAIRPILDRWTEAGMPASEPFDGVKINIETYGPISGRVRIEADIPGRFEDIPGPACRSV